MVRLVLHSLITVVKFENQLLYQGLQLVWRTNERGSVPKLCINRSVSIKIFLVELVPERIEDYLSWQERKDGTPHRRRRRGVALCTTPRIDRD